MFQKFLNQNSCVILFWLAIFVPEKKRSPKPSRYEEFPMFSSFGTIRKTSNAHWLRNFFSRNNVVLRK